jgi:hypothetical protein
VTAVSQTVLKLLPAGITPYVLSFNASNVPIINLVLSSKTLPQDQLFDLVPAIRASFSSGTSGAFSSLTTLIQTDTVFKNPCSNRSSPARLKAWAWGCPSRAQLSRRTMGGYGQKIVITAARRSGSGFLLSNSC